MLEAVIGGPKRATAALVAEFADGDEELPRIGSHWICCDGSGHPRLFQLRQRVDDDARIRDLFDNRTSP